LRREVTCFHDTHKLHFLPFLTLAIIESGSQETLELKNIPNIITFARIIAYRQLSHLWPAENYASDLQKVEKVLNSDNETRNKFLTAPLFAGFCPFLLLIIFLGTLPYLKSHSNSPSKLRSTYYSLFSSFSPLSLPWV